MEKIESFKVNHHNLLPGIYISRTDNVADQVLITYDIRVTQPNAQPVLNTAEIHTIEHLAATFL
ncbi:MAG: S-ribosylhomocysteine lyase, partial [Erysipelotrichaceae bacterium]